VGLKIPRRFKVRRKKIYESLEQDYRDVKDPGKRGGGLNLEDSRNWIKPRD